MKKILLTGGTGFIGRNILPILRQEYDVDAPGRQLLNVYEKQSVDKWLCEHSADFLVHCAIATPANPLDNNQNILESTLRSFAHFKNHEHRFEKIIYIGSGAEYGKQNDISDVSENDIGRILPADEYGLSKYILNDMARHSENIVNLRIFGCYGPFEPARRFIRHAIECCLENRAVTMRGDCRFSYVFVEDLGKAILCVLNKKTKFHDYNIVGQSPLLSDLAKTVLLKTGKNLPIEIEKTGTNKEYTGTAKRFLDEFPHFEFTPLENGIEREISWKTGEIA